LSLDAAAEHVVDLGDQPLEFADLFASFEHVRSGFESADVGRAPCGLNDVVRVRFADIGGVREFARTRDGDALIRIIPVLPELVSGCGADTGQFLEVFRACCHIRHCDRPVHKGSLTAW